MARREGDAGEGQGRDRSASDRTPDGRASAAATAATLSRRGVLVATGGLLAAGAAERARARGRRGGESGHGGGNAPAGASPSPAGADVDQRDPLLTEAEARLVQYRALQRRRAYEGAITYFTRSRYESDALEEAIPGPIETAVAALPPGILTQVVSRGEALFGAGEFADAARHAAGVSEVFDRGALGSLEGDDDASPGDAADTRAEFRTLAEKARRIHDAAASYAGGEGRTEAGRERLRRLLAEERELLRAESTPTLVEWTEIDPESYATGTGLDPTDVEAAAEFVRRTAAELRLLCEAFGVQVERHRAAAADRDDDLLLDALVAAFNRRADRLPGAVKRLVDGEVVEFHVREPGDAERAWAAFEDGRIDDYGDGTTSEATMGVWIDRETIREIAASDAPGRRFGAAYEDGEITVRAYSLGSKAKLWGGKLASNPVDAAGDAVDGAVDAVGDAVDGAVDAVGDAVDGVL